MREEVTACKEKTFTLEKARDKLQERCDCINAEKVEAFMESNKVSHLLSK